MNQTPSMAVVVAGMHRSGTSMTASFIQALGVDVGRDLMEADANNRKGYFEDWDFVRLNQAIFRAACPPNEPGWPEVGWTESESLDEAAVRAFAAEADQLVKARAGLALWGWKDPRTTLLLPFWRARLPAARWVLVYRDPWDVVDSLFRAEHAVFDDRPDFALRIWGRYNRQLLAFYRAHPQDCLLVHTRALKADLGGFAGRLAGKLGLPVRDEAPAQTLQGLVDERLMKELPADHPLIPLVAAHHPDALALLAELDAVADMPSGRAPAAGPPDRALDRLHLRLVRLAEVSDEHVAALRQRADASRQEAAAHRQEADAQRQEAAAQRRAAEAQRRAGETYRQAAEVSREEAGACRLEAEEQRAQAAERERALQAMLASTSWRLTAPLRRLVRAWRRTDRGTRS